MTDQTVSFAAGESNFVTGEPIDEKMFGGIFTGYRSLSRFSDSVENLGLTSIRWPGGSPAENADWYGLEFPDLVDPASGKAGLSDVLSYATANGLAVNLIVPTAEYASSLAAAGQAVEQLLTQLADGTFGTLPSSITIELGNEYFAQSVFQGAPGTYGSVANAMLATIEQMKALYPDVFSTGQIKFAVQMGRNVADAAAIIEEIDPSLMTSIDMLAQHRFAYTMRDASAKTDQDRSVFNEWVDAGITPGTELFLSAWNMASWTRKEAQSKYISLYQEYFDVALDPATIDLDSRNNVNFENYWQHGVIIGPDETVLQTADGLVHRDYGLAQASGMLELLSSYIALGTDRANLYGTDTQWAANVTNGDTVLVGGKMLSLLADALPGKHALDIGIVNSRDALINTYAFQDSQELVVYLTADAGAHRWAPQSVTFDLEALGYELQHVQMRSLTSAISSDWLAEQAIPDNEYVDETPEARLFDQGTLSDAVSLQTSGSLTIEFSEPFQVVELRISLGEQTSEFPVSAPVLGSPGDDEITGTSDQDEIWGSSGSDVLYGLEDDDILFSHGGADTIFAGAGNDIVHSGTGQDLVYLQDGDDRYNDSEENTIWGSDTVYGGLGDDQIYLRGGDDWADGGAGQDLLDGGFGDDFLDGGDGDDILLGGHGDDVMNGGAGNDLLVPGAGSLVINGGTGIDTLDLFGLGEIRVIATEYVSAMFGVPNYSQGTFENLEAIITGELDDFVLAGSAIQSIKTFGGDDEINMRSLFSASVEAGNGNDRIVDSPGNDQINAGAGDDIIEISGGVDTVTLGDGLDQLYIDSASTKTIVHLTDFDVNEDQIFIDFRPFPASFELARFLDEAHTGQETGVDCVMPSFYSIGRVRDDLEIGAHHANIYIVLDEFFV